MAGDRMDVKRRKKAYLYQWIKHAVVFYPSAHRTAIRGVTIFAFLCHPEPALAQDEQV
jgi:hypothetical protein